LAHPRAQRRQRRRRARPSASDDRGGRERLLAAAVELFAEQGYAATGIAEVCARAGVAKTALYWHFDNKEGLLAAVIESIGTSWIEQIRKAAYQAGTAEERIERLVSEWRRILLEQPELLRLPIVAQLEQGDSLRARDAVRTIWQRAEWALIEGIEDTMGRSLPDVDLVAHTIFALLQGALLRQIVDPDEAQLDRVLGELQRTIVLLIADRLPAGSTGPARSPS
jgi:TetR/AcrR family fatty acid metabolism transcriptional regulator